MGISITKTALFTIGKKISTVAQPVKHREKTKNSFNIKQ